jgi:hypothetical protein
MAFLRRLGIAVVLLLSTVGILCCVAGIISGWVFYQRVSEKVRTILDNLDDGLQRMSAANETVRGAVAPWRPAGHVVGRGRRTLQLA